ncbi:MAG: DUF1574 family protein [Chlorobium limicola]|uniref:DUF1574 family protein n=1 Tax=Chlorobium limicola TaxID=1092 RepID=UPI0023F2AD12|nr:DUF1574 family protein [Chlorobium limicola]NTV20930.1 DUF1574 family protein [Chlorobium limicola]
MKKLLLKLVFFSIPLLPIGLIAEYMLRSIPNDYKVKVKQYEKNALHFSILCLGESHAYSGINPEYFDDNGFNGSHFAQTLNYDLEILKRFEHNLQNLKYLLLPISYGSFTNRLENRWEVKNYSLYYNIKQKHDIRYYTEILSLPLDISIDKLKSYYIMHESPLMTDSLGYSTLYSKHNPDKNLVESGKKMAAVQTAKDYRNWNKNRKSLDEIIARCKKRGITVILFTPPAHSYYRMHLDPTQLNKTLLLAASFAKKNKNVFYLNFLRDDSFLEDDFYDADHFSRTGAKKLTNKLNTFIEDLEKSTEN